MIVHPEHPSVLLLAASDLTPEAVAPRADGSGTAGLSAAIVDPARQIFDWAHTYLSRPHADLGRPGPVCPYVPSALRSSTLYLAVVPGVPADGAAIERELQVYRDWFGRLEPVSEPDADLKTILVLFPDVPNLRLEELIEDTQGRLKASFVRDGLMIGEFHPGPPAQPGLWNPDFRPLHSPVPLLAIRRMVSSDLPFLTHDREWFQAYRQRFGAAVPARCQDQYNEALARFEPGPAGGHAHPEVLCALHRHGVDYTVHVHAEQPGRIEAPADLARALGYSRHRITKTLLLESADGASVVRVVAGSAQRVDLRRVAAQLSLPRLRMASAARLEACLGQPPGGVSPLGASAVPVLVDAALMHQPTVLVGSGVRGVDLELTPWDLSRAAGAEVITLSEPSTATNHEESYHERP